MRLETERLLMRRWTLDDAEAALEMYGDPEVTRYLPGAAVPDLPAMRERLTAMKERAAVYGPDLGTLAVVHEGHVVGCALIKPLPGPDDELTEDIEIGWHLARRHWGKGLATEMGRALLAYGVDTLGLPDLHAVVDPPNTASMRVAQRVGLTHVGRTRAYYAGIELEHFRLHG